MRLLIVAAGKDARFGSADRDGIDRDRTVFCVT